MLSLVQKFRTACNISSMFQNIIIIVNGFRIIERDLSPEVLVCHLLNKLCCGGFNSSSSSMESENFTNELNLFVFLK